MFVAHAEAPRRGRGERYDVSSLQVAVHAAAPCPVPVKQAMIDWWGPIVYEYYGGTEAQRAHVHPARGVARAPGLGRRPILGELHILDDDGDELPTARSGTIYFADGMDFEYHNDPDKTADARTTAAAGPPSATSATSTTRATSTSPTARRS